MADQEEHGWGRHAQDEEEAQEPAGLGPREEGWWTHEARAELKSDAPLLSTFWADVTRPFSGHTKTAKTREALEAELYRIGADSLERDQGVAPTTLDSIRAEAHVSSHGRDAGFRAQNACWALDWHGTVEEAEQLLATVADAAGPEAFWQTFAAGSAQLELLRELDRVGVIAVDAFSAVTSADVALHEWREQTRPREEPPAASAADLVELAWSADGDRGVRVWFGRLSSALDRLRRVVDGGGVAALGAAFPAESSELPVAVGGETTTSEGTR